MSRRPLDALTGPSRRRLLQALGLAGGALWLPSLSRRAHAQGAPPKLLIFCTGHGTVWENFELRPEGVGEDQDFTAPLADLNQAELSPILAPLHAHRRRLVVLDGVSNCAGLRTPVNEHVAAGGTCLTGRGWDGPNDDVYRPRGPSIDQLVASTRDTPLRSVEIGIGAHGICFDLYGNPVPMETSPRALYELLFPGSLPNQNDRPSRVARSQGSVLDLVQQRYATLTPQLSGADRQRLEQHQQLVRDMERRVESLHSLECEAEIDPEALREDSWQQAWELDAAAVFFDLSVIALRCGFTDVVTIRSESVQTTTLGGPAGDVHNDYAHRSANDADAVDMMTRFHSFHAARFAELLDRLDAAGAGDGSLLDGTLAWWANELGSGVHDMHRVPSVLAGGGVLNEGHYLRFAPTHTLEGTWGRRPQVGPPHNRLLRTLGHSLGVDGASFGPSSFDDVEGEAIDATAPLPGLLV